MGKSRSSKHKPGKVGAKKGGKHGKKGSGGRQLGAALTKRGSQYRRLLTSSPAAAGRKAGAGGNKAAATASRSAAAIARGYAELEERFGGGGSGRNSKEVRKSIAALMMENRNKLLARMASGESQQRLLKARGAEDIMDLMDKLDTRQPGELRRIAQLAKSAQGASGDAGIDQLAALMLGAAGSIGGTGSGDAPGGAPGPRPAQRTGVSFGVESRFAMLEEEEAGTQPPPSRQEQQRRGPAISFAPGVLRPPSADPEAPRIVFAKSTFGGAPQGSLGGAPQPTPGNLNGLLQGVALDDALDDL